MLPTTIISLGMAFFSSIALATPVKSIQQGSSHNVYLATCEKEVESPGDCILIICEPPTVTRTTFSAAAYYPNGGIEAGGDSPSQLATVSQPPAPWEGGKRSTNIVAAGVFTSNIDAGAKSRKKGELAGSATLGTEDFTCFRDGQSEIPLSTRNGPAQGGCIADYWCASIQV